MPTLFTDVLRQARKGVAVQRLTEDLADLTKTCVDLGKAGELTLKIKVTPDKSGSGVVDLEFDVTVKRPRPSLPKSPFYVDAEGSLLRSDPNQSEMFEDAEDRRARTNA